MKEIRSKISIPRGLSKQDRVYNCLVIVVPFVVATLYCFVSNKFNYPLGLVFNIFLLVMLISFAIYCFYYWFVLYKKNEDVFEGVTKSDMVDLFDIWLYQFSRSKLGFENGKKYSDRITLYIYDKYSNSFVPCGRYSPNPEFNEQKKFSYPNNEGCIAEGWRIGWCFDRDGKYPINNKNFKNIRMKSELYAVKRVDLHNNNLAVLVIESEDVNKFTERQILSILKNDESKMLIYHLAELIERLYNGIPIPSDAKGAGL